jgi:nucleotide-binding universal stress UspA family protein
VTAEGERAERRIVVALDDSPHGRAALEAASELAARLHAELVGLFVEDIELLQLAALPFAAEVRYLAGQCRALDVDAMRRALRVEGARLASLLTAVAGKHGVTAHFRIATGRVGAELVAAAEPNAMLVLGKTSRRQARSVGLGTTARAVVHGFGNTVLLLEHGARIAAPVVVAIDEDSAATRRALAVAAELTRSAFGELVVVVPPDETSLAERATDLVTGLDIPLRLFVASSRDSAGLIQAARDAGCGTLVLQVDSRFLAGTTVSDFAALVAWPVVFVR